MDRAAIVDELLELVVEYCEYINHPERFGIEQTRLAIQNILHRILDLAKRIEPPAV